MTRSKTYGVGKEVRDTVYVHTDYEDVLPKRVQRLKAELPPDFSYNIVKYNQKAGNASFIRSPDFDDAPEPTVRKSCKVDEKNGVRCREYRNNPPIYHGKWKFVDDDYDGFDIDASRWREELWKSIPDVDTRRIGRKDYWETEVVPQIETLGYDRDDVDIMRSTGMKGGATAEKNVVTRHMFCTPYPKDKKILDFGAGKHAIQTDKLKDEYPHIRAHDFPETVKESDDDLFDDRALANKYDIVLASNVLNVQPSDDSIRKTVSDIYNCMNDGGQLIANIPKNPIKYPLSYAEFKKKVINELSSVFGEKNVEITDTVCGEPTSSAIITAQK